MFLITLPFAFLDSYSMIDSIHFASISKVADLLQRKEISAVELTEFMLNRIEALDVNLKSYATICADHAMEAAIKAEAYGAFLIDINMGCPVPKITKKGKGVALMKDINKTAKLINHVRKNTTLPLTVKIRSGWDQNNLNALEFSKMLEQEGVDAITIHPRSRLQQFTGMSKWEIISEIVSSVRIPVTGSGDVKSLLSAKSMMKKMSVN